MDEVIVYWSPGNFIQSQESWNGLYAEPKSIRSTFNTIKSEDINNDKNLFLCPASNSLLKNMFVFNAMIDDKYSLPIEYLNSIEDTELETILPEKGNTISFSRNRKSSLKDYYDIEYNMGWIMFAEEPLMATFTPPYLPSVSPAKGSIMASASFDIGLWCRAFNLNYFIPKDTTELIFKKDEPLFYVKFETNKKVIFKRFIMTETIQQIRSEFATFPRRYGKFMPLSQRYEDAKKTKMTNILLSEIKKNVVD